ncbi:MAG: ATP-binding cassette domain-containing protein [Candidatus Binataceae bacterium]
MPVTVELERARKCYDGLVAVESLSLSISGGEIFGLLGPNGAGKTSTIRMMIGITRPDSGAVRVFGNPVARATLSRVGYLPEERGLYRRMTVRDNLSFLGQLAGLTAAQALERGRAWTVRLELEDWFERRVEELSKGMQQKIQFVAALIHDPEFIVMDEPFGGLDPVNADELKEILLELKAQGRTIVLSTHRMDQAEKLCDAICLINGGRAILQGNLREIKSQYGERFVQIDYAGANGLLAGHPMVEARRDFGNHLEVKLRAGADPQELLHAAAASARISRFELMEPSLEEIFIDRVGRRDA